MFVCCIGYYPVSACAVMTKLMQWLAFFFAFLAVWISVLFDYLPVQLDRSSKEVIWMVRNTDVKNIWFYVTWI